MHKTQVERTRRLRTNNKAKGLTQVTVTIPQVYAAELKAIARVMREACTRKDEINSVTPLHVYRLHPIMDSSSRGTQELGK